MIVRVFDPQDILASPCGTVEGSDVDVTRRGETRGNCERKKSGGVWGEGINAQCERRALILDLVAARLR